MSRHSDRVAGSTTNNRDDDNATDGAPTGNLTLLKGMDSLESLAEVWTELEGRNNLPVFQRLAWAQRWLKHMGRGGEPWLLVTGDPIQGILPLFYRQRVGWKSLTFIGHGISDYLGPICGSSAAATELGVGLGRLAGRVDLTVLRGINPDDDYSAYFLAGIEGPVAQRVYERCPAIETRHGWDVYWRDRKKKFRANAKHTRRRVEEQGSVVVTTERASRRLFDEMLEVERASWKWDRGFAFLRDTSLRGFLEDVFFSNEVPQQLWTCRIDGVLVGFALVFTLERRWHYYWPSFREDAWGAGLYLMEKIVQQCCDLGFDEFDFLGGDEAYKKRWMTHEHHTAEVVVPGRHPFGPIAVWSFRARWWLARSGHLREARRRFMVAWKRGGG